MKEYRKLSAEEIALLEAAACTAEDWNEVEVAEGFDARCVRNVNFSGKIRLGSFGHIFELPGGVRRKAGIENACLHNVSLGDGCLVRNVNNYIANYEIGDRCFIENVGVMAVDRESSFGNGVRVSVLNETGGREVTISERLSSQLAYVVALYRHRPEFIAKVEERLRVRVVRRAYVVHAKFLHQFYSLLHGARVGGSSEGSEGVVVGIAFEQYFLAVEQQPLTSYQCHVAYSEAFGHLVAHCSVFAY